MTAREEPARASEPHGYERALARGWARLALAVLAALGAPYSQGCTRWIAHAIVDAPNAGRSFDIDEEEDGARRRQLGVGRRLDVDVGPPAARLVVWIIDPAPTVASSSRPRGTILLLHGVRDSKLSQVSLGRTLSASGYRAVLVDLRGHGDSTGDWLTYGVIEARDLVQVLDALGNEGLLDGLVGAMGTSHGGAVAIQLAAIDSRLEALVAVSTFTSVREVVPSYVARYGLAWLVSEATLDRALAQASGFAGVDLDDASPLQAIARTQARVLLMHGEDDEHIPCEHSRRMHAAAAGRARLLLLENEDHASIAAGGAGTMAEILAWLDPGRR